MTRMRFSLELGWLVKVAVCELAGNFFPDRHTDRSSKQSAADDAVFWPPIGTFF